MSEKTNKRDSDNTALRFFYRILNYVIPENRTGDRIFSYILFIFKHKRLPSNKMLFNDVLYKIKTSNEILDPLRVLVSDKEHLKNYVRSIVGEQYNVRTFGILNDPEEVDRYEFPDNCCIKPTHLSGKVILRTNNGPIDSDKIKSWFKLNRYSVGREANYKTLKPKIIIEELIFGRTNVEDFKFFCYNGVPKLIQVDIDRSTNHTRKFFDPDWSELEFSIIYPRNLSFIKKPDNLSEMLTVVKKLSEPFGFIRVDLYSNGKNILVGEITNCSENAGGYFIPRSAEKNISEDIFN
jgi:hypothetical protein